MYRRTLIQSAAALAALSVTPIAASSATSNRYEFGKMADGTVVDAVKLTNKNGVSATIITYGATLQALKMPSKITKTTDDVVLGFDTLEGYTAAPSYLGVTVGRYANRIAGAQFSLDGVVYKLPSNDGANSLHGGKVGFDQRVWEITKFGQSFVTMKLISPDGDQGYPGTLTVFVTYRLSADNALSIDYEATTDKPTVVNLTNHALFNLLGAKSGHSAMGSLMQIEADHYTPVDKNLIPTGELAPVAGTALDFRKRKSLGAAVRDGNDPQINIGLGVDHNFVIRKSKGTGPKRALTMSEPRNGRSVTLLTTEPGVQVYTGNFLSGRVKGKGNRLMRQGDGVAFEPQKFPDSPNQPQFPSARLDPGQTYRQTSVFALGW